MRASRRLSLLLAGLSVAALQNDRAMASSPQPYHTGSNKEGTSYSATVTTNGRGVWIAVHSRQSYSGSYAVQGKVSNPSYGYGTVPVDVSNQTGSGVRTASASTIARSWSNQAGEPYYETTNGQVYHLAGISVGTAGAGPIAAGMRQHPGTVPEALYVNGKLQSIIWVPTEANTGALHWGTPPTASGNVTASAPVVIDPRAVAANVLQHIPLPNVRLSMNPSLGLVALPGWFWAEGYDGAPFGGSASVSGLTVAVQVQPSSYAWNFGDGTSQVTQDLGQPYPAQSDIQHTYQYSSLHFSAGFPIRLTIQYAATFSVNGGAAQPLASMTRTYTTSYRVQEIQSVLTKR